MVVSKPVRRASKKAGAPRARKSSTGSAAKSAARGRAGKAALALPPARAVEPSDVPIIELPDFPVAEIEEAVESLTGELNYWFRRGMDTRVRLKLRGRPILPDVPVAAFLAAQAATFAWAGLLRALAVNAAGGALFDFEVISNAEPQVARGVAHLLDGDIDEALECFQTAVAADRGHATAHLKLGICYKLRRDQARARACFERALELDGAGTAGAEARRQLEKLRSA